MCVKSSSLAEVDVGASETQTILNASFPAQEDESPVPASSLKNFNLVFDAVYTPVWTRLLLDAKAEGCQVREGQSLLLAFTVDHSSHTHIYARTHSCAQTGLCRRTRTSLFLLHTGGRWAADVCGPGAVPV